MHFAANPVLGSGMALTRSSRSASRRRIGSPKTCKPFRVSGGIEYHCERKIKRLLNYRSPRRDAAELSDLLKHVGTHRGRNEGLVRLYNQKILTTLRISNMWKIASENQTDRAADMLPPRNDFVKWVGKSGKIIEKMSGRKRKRGDGNPQREFPLKGEWEMEIRNRGNGGPYEVHFKGKSGLLVVEENPNGVPESAQPIKSAFTFKAEIPLLDQFVLYTRSVGPNVLVVQAWKGNQETRLWAELVIIKMRRNLSR